uniref:Uncharacterized protein n=1 Tax=Clytia hemisphaerica TaxID=252671 RepID=A0A7M5TWP0_9CNID
MLNWSILVVLRWAGDRNYYYSDLTPIDGEAAITMLGNITLWMFNIVFIFMNITEIANRLRGGDVNIHKIILGMITGVLSVIQSFLHYRMNRDEMAGLVDASPCFIICQRRK